MVGQRSIATDCRRVPYRRCARPSAHALRDGLVQRNVAAALARPPRVPGRGGGIPGSSRPAGATCWTPSPMTRLGPLVTLAATTGLRQGELLGFALVSTWTSFWRCLPCVRRWPVTGPAATRLAEPNTHRRPDHLLPADPSPVEALERQRAQQGAARVAAAGPDTWQDAGRAHLHGPVSGADSGAIASQMFPLSPAHTGRRQACPVPCAAAFVGDARAGVGRPVEGDR